MRKKNVFKATLFVILTICMCILTACGSSSSKGDSEEKITLSNGVTKAISPIVSRIDNIFHILTSLRENEISVPDNLASYTTGMTLEELIPFDDVNNFLRDNTYKIQNSKGLIGTDSSSNHEKMAVGTADECKYNVALYVYEADGIKYIVSRAIALPSGNVVVCVSYINDGNGNYLTLVFNTDGTKVEGKAFEGIQKNVTTESENYSAFFSGTASQITYVDDKGNSQVLNF